MRKGNLMMNISRQFLQADTLPKLQSIQSRTLFRLEEVMKLDDHEEKEINNIYNQKETPKL